MRYTRLTGSRADKELALRTPLRHQAWSTAASGWGEPFLPITGRAWRRWVALDELMPVRQSGVQTKRDRLVVAPTRAQLAQRLLGYGEADLEQRRLLFHETRDRALPLGGTDADLIRRYGYRPLSRSWLYDDPRFVDFARPRLHQLLHPGQRFFVTLPKGHGAGPAVFQHVDLPDLHSFRGSVGGHVFPLWLDAQQEVPNLAAGLLERLSEHLGVDVTAESVFDYTYAALSAPSYTALFRTDLAQGFPRLPVPLQRPLFDELADLGGRLRAAHDLDRHELLPRLEGRPGPVAEGKWEDGRLFVAPDAYVPDVPEAAWLYEVSGYRVIARWLRQRQGLDLSADLDLVDELRRVVAAVQQTVALGPALDAGLRRVLDGDTLGRASLIALDPLRMAAERSTHHADEESLQRDLALWDDVTAQALRLGEQAR